MNASLVLLLPGAAALNAVVITVVVVLLGWESKARRTVGVASGVLGVALVAYLLMVFLGTPAGAPAPPDIWCESNVPPWWPHWIPV